MKFFNRKTLDKIFELGILIKSFFGVFEILGGIFLGLSGGKIINNFILFLTGPEIANDPDDFFANYLIKLGNNIALGSRIFAVVYLVIHGIINILLVASLSKEENFSRHRKKIYPLAMLVFSIFVVYQLYKYFYSHSLVLLLLSIFDIIFVYIIYLEYKKNK